MVKKAVILCGGLATRFLPISKSIPKEMLPLLDKPIVQILVEDLKKAGITDVLIILGRNKEAIMRHFDHSIELENRLESSGKLEFLKVATEPCNLCNMYYIMQDKPMGTAHCIDLAKGFVGSDPFILLFGDEIMVSENKNIIEQLIDNYNKYNKSVISVQNCRREDVYKYGILSVVPIENGASRVIDIVEKPKVEDAPSTLCYLGAALLTSDVYKYLDKCVLTKGELSITDAYKLMGKDNLLNSQEIDGKRYDMGNKLGFVIANIDAALRDNEYKAELIDYIKSLKLD